MYQSLPVFSYEHTFTTELCPLTVTFEGAYDAGSPARGFGGPPENYDAGEEASTTILSVRAGGATLAYEALEDILSSLLGEEEAARQLEAAERAMTAHFERTNPAPDYVD